MHNTIKHITLLGNYDVPTGYYGARCYEPTLALWYGVDKLAEKYPSIGGYVYCVGNPMKYVDPDGNDWYEAEDGTMQYTNKHYENQKDFDKNSGLKGVWCGYTTEKDGTYYGLLGDFCKISTKDENYEFCKAIDNAIVVEGQVSTMSIDPFSSEPPTTPSSDFSKAYKNVRFKGGITNTSRPIYSFYNKGNIEITNTDTKQLHFDGMNGIIASEHQDAIRNLKNNAGKRGLGYGTSSGYIISFSNTSKSVIWVVIKDLNAAETIKSNYYSLFNTKK